MPVDNYPTDDELQRIREWDALDPRGWFDFIQSVGNYWPEDWYWDETTDTGATVYHVSTGGWSGNEDIIRAMKENFVLWSMNWESHRRGGHYTFIFKDPQTGQPTLAGDA